MLRPRYPAGDSENEQLFACVQRGHQQALENYPQYLALSLIAGAFFPVTTALEGLLYIQARLAWADNYAKGKPENRSAGVFAKHIWTPFMHLLVLSVYVAGRFLWGSI